jgi:hypothetical protein
MECVFSRRFAKVKGKGKGKRSLPGVPRHRENGARTEFGGTVVPSSMMQQSLMTLRAPGGGHRFRFDHSASMWVQSRGACSLIMRRRRRRRRIRQCREWICASLHRHGSQAERFTDAAILPNGDPRADFEPLDACPAPDVGVASDVDRQVANCSSGRF